MRSVRIASTSFLIDESPHTIEQNIYRACAYIEEAGSKGADIICLPESVTTANVSIAEQYSAERYPGAWTKTFSQCAKKNKINVIVPYWTQTKNKKYNQATVFNRQGKISGYYRKVQPHAEELRHIIAGSEFPVFALDFGKITVMICMDIYFPEIARIYAMKGAEIIFWTTTTVGPTQEGLEAQIKSRAIDNSIYIVEANYIQRPPYAPYAGRWRPGNARIVDYNGDIIAQTGRRDGLAICEIDLDDERRTSQVILKREPDHTREDMEELVRLDIYAKEYAALSDKRKNFHKKLTKK